MVAIAISAKDISIFLVAIGLSIMYKNSFSLKSFNQPKYQCLKKPACSKLFLSAIATVFATVLLSGTSVVNAQSAPQALHSGIQIRNVINTFSSSPSVRIAKDPRDNTLYYLKQNGEIYQVDLASATSKLLYSANEHGLSNTQGMAIGPDGSIYLIGNTDVADGQTGALSRTKATILKGIINPNTGQRAWSVLAFSADYPKSNTAFDHRLSGVVVSPSGDFIYVNSGSRTDHGEVQSAGGLYPDTREVGLTACILRLPTNGQNIFLENDRAALKAAGYIFAEGTRNTFDLAFAPNGDLIGTENGPDRDMPEELNWLREGLHYGFPWRIGGADNPQQFPDYNPATDLLLDPRFIAVRSGFYYNDPSFPARPPIDLIEPIVNLGPDADSFRDLQDGQIKDASDLGQNLSTFTTHRSPLGLVFDTAGVMSSEFQGDGFMLSWTAGDSTGNTVAGPFKDASQDLVHLDLTKTGNSNYQVRTTRIVSGFSNPIDAEIVGNKIYVLEYGTNQGIWEIAMPTASTGEPIVVYEHGDFAGRSQAFLPGTYRADRDELNVVGNDAISSLRVPPGLSVTLSEHETGGITRTYGPGDYPYVGDEFNDKASLIIVEVR